KKIIICTNVKDSRVNSGAGQRGFLVLGMSPYPLDQLEFGGSSLLFLLGRQSKSKKNHRQSSKSCGEDHEASRGERIGKLAGRSCVVATTEDPALGSPSEYVDLEPGI
ncbi:hypothetical protein CLAIMM_05873 isoform 2, partial [Cladophialophora immunda]